LWTGILCDAGVGVALSNDLLSAASDIPVAVGLAGITCWSLWPVRLPT